MLGNRQQTGHTQGVKRGLGRDTLTRAERKENDRGRGKRELTNPLSLLTDSDSETSHKE